MFIYLLCSVPVSSELEIFRYVLFRGIQKPKCLAPFAGMFGMVYIVSVDHPLQVGTSLFGSPSQTLMDDDVMEDDLENPIAKDAQSYGEQIRIVVD